MRQGCSVVFRISLAIAVMVVAQTVATGASSEPQPQNDLIRIIDETGIKGGLIVHVGCGDDGSLLRQYGAKEPFFVFALDTNGTKVASLRSALRTEGYGSRVLVEEWNGAQLPFIDNFVSVLVLQESAGLSGAEEQRVLEPGGKIVRRQGAAWVVETKLHSPLMDDWTHWSYSAANTRCSRDQVVGPLRQLQWYTRPFWSKYHFSSPAVHFIISGNGRVFYTADQSPSSTIGGGFPEKWALVARDAFNGKLLWQRPLSEWGMAMYDVGSFQQGKILNLPQHDRNQRRFVVDGDQLFGVLSYHGPVVTIDAASGKVLHTFKGTESCNQVYAHHGRLYVLNKESPELLVFNPDTGDTIWSDSRYKPSAIAISGNQLCLLSHSGIHAFDLTTFKEQWVSSSVPSAGFLMHAGSVVLGREQNSKWLAYSARDGRELWARTMPVQTRRQGTQSNFRQVFATSDRVWMFQTEFDLVGVNPVSGEPEVTVPAKDLFLTTHHHRCFDDRATERYFISGQEGVEFTSLTGEINRVHNWTRGTCNTGVTPANGLLYVPPSACACYAHAMLHGLYAYAPQRPQSGREYADQERLTTGPAFGKLTVRPPAAADWPMYRCDAQRRSTTSTKVPLALRQRWTTTVGGQLTPPVIADGRLLVANKADHTVRAFDASTGAALWTFCAGGMVDSSPSLWGNCVIFGCADGRVYCLRADDGVLVWRFQAAPRDCRNMQLENISSPWPVHGSVLVDDGRVYCAAGHSSRLDGGIYVYALDAMSGAVLATQRLHDVSPEVQPPTNERPNDQEGVRADLFVGDGHTIFMQHLSFDDKLNVTKHSLSSGVTGINEIHGITAEPHVYTGSGFLDDSWNHRMVWTYGGIHAQLLTADQQNVYGIKAYDESGFHARYQPGLGYILFAQSIRKPGGKVIGGKDISRTELRPHPFDSYTWSQRVPLRVQSLLRAGDLLIVAGQPDVVVKDDPFAAFEGRAGGKLWIMSPSDGRRLAELELASPPVYDGLAVANNRLYLSTMDGGVVCFAGKEGQP